ncbi:TraI/MobA(P) family conjugative relaxase [Photorhabdus asymbiotica]|uniref:TraI/MobA(P) family conjugative relaxase n=1 Tax=Photorhabdus asymbiotica TaxID=291112 RepID=UPI003DA71477
MIPKIIKNKNQAPGKEGIQRLISYISTKNADHSDNLSDLHSSTSNYAENLANYLVRKNQNVIEFASYFDDTSMVSVDGISIIHNLDCDFQNAAISMQATAQEAVRCSHPIMHYVLSWQADETPTEKQIFESARFTLEALGMKDHQYMVAIHRDTDNIHVHIAVNRVNPLTLRVNKATYSQEILHKSCRLLELQYGFKHDAGAYIVDELGNVVRNKNRSCNVEIIKPENAYKKERYTGMQSLYSYIQNEVVEHFDGSNKTLLDEFKYGLKSANSWQDVHRIFARAGFTLEPSKHAGGLLLIYNKGEPEQISVNWRNLFKNQHDEYDNLCLRFGVFEPPTTEELSMKHDLGKGYSSYLSIGEADLRKEKRTERLAQRLLLRGRYEQYKSNLPLYPFNKNEFSQNMKAIHAHVRSMKRTVKSTYSDPVVRRQFYNLCEFERYKQISALKLAESESRNGFYAANPRLTYRQWVENEALSGDAAALSQLRGWYYSQAKKKCHQEVVMSKFGETRDSAINAIICHGRGEVAPANSESFGLKPELLKDGSIVYRDSATNDPILLDRGSVIFTRSNAQEQHKVAAVGLALKGDTNCIKAMGSDDFKAACYKVAEQYKSHYKQLSHVSIEYDVDSQNMKNEVQKNINQQLQNNNNGVHLSYK